MIRKIAVVVLLGVLLTASRAAAWDAHGHKTIASVAYRQLTSDEQNKVIDILSRHPRYRPDFKDAMDEGLRDSDEAEWIFQQAAVWPDLARGLPDRPRKMYHRPMWHFINMPVFLTDDDRLAMHASLKVDTKTPDQESRDLNAIQIIRYSRRALTDPHTSQQDRARLMCWLVHVVGDIHQPMHSAALFSQTLFPDGDMGGNAIEVEDMGNLHSVWDHSLGKTKEFRGCRNHAIRLLHDDKLKLLGESAAKDLNEDNWLHESVDIASSVAYGSEVLEQLRAVPEDEDAPPVVVSEDYLRNAHAIARKRATQAGYRLGAILKEVVNH
jgi:hypothetical protein